MILSLQVENYNEETNGNAELRDAKAIARNADILTAAVEAAPDSNGEHSYSAHVHEVNTITIP